MNKRVQLRMSQEIQIKTSLIIAVIIAAAILVGSGLLALAWRANSRDISERQNKELTTQLEIQKELLDAKEKAATQEASDKEVKRTKYIDCLVTATKGVKNMTEDYINLARQICKDKTGFKE